MLSHIEFTGLNFTCTDAEKHRSVNGTCPISTGQEALDQVGMGNVNLAVDFGCLIGLTGLFLAIAYFCLRIEMNRH